MCGIAGLLATDRRWGRPQLEQLTRALQHRGPDAEGFHWDETRRVGLGHRRLSILDLSAAANQPMASHDGRWVMVYNGEVYNYADIARELRLELLTRSDTEVMLEAFAREGVEAVRRFNGMFALALYDNQLGELHLMRDPVGIKPLVYTFGAHGLAFASELKALLTLDLPRAISPQALDDYLHYEYIPGPQSIFQHIQKLEPGTRLTLAPGGQPRLTPFTRLEQWAVRGPARSDAEWRERFEATLLDSLRRQQMADVPVGAFLSGGTDSSLVVTAYRQVSPEPVRTFTIGFDEKGYDETPYAEAVARHLGTRHQTLPLPAAAGLAEFERLVDHYDEPFAAPSALPSMAVTRLARGQVKVALAGDGGDELFMGYGTYAWQQRLARLRRTLGPLGPAAAGALLEGAAAFGGVPYRRAARVANAGTHASNWPDVWAEEQYMFSRGEITALRGHAYSPETLHPRWAQITTLGLEPSEALALFDLTTYLPHDLMYKMDIAAMAVGLEVRVPLLDLELIRLALQLPLHLRRSGSTAKVLMKQVLERHLPRELVHRRKWGFPAPVRHWLGGPLRPQLERYLSRPALEHHGLFNPKLVAELRAQFDRGQWHHYKRLWALLCFQMWYERYVDADLIPR